MLLQRRSPYNPGDGQQPGYFPHLIAVSRRQKWEGIAPSPRITRVVVRTHPDLQHIQPDLAKKRGWGKARRVHVRMQQ